MLNRRRFIGAAGLGILTVRRTLWASAHFDLGIGTYTYRGLSEEQMIEDLLTLKIHQIELSSPNYFLPNVKLQAVQMLRRKLEQAGIQAVSYFCGDMKTQADVNTTVEVARGLGVRHVSGSAVGESLKLVDATFTREGLKFGIHNHWFRGRKFAYESPEDVLGALANVSETIGATMDAGHMASCGYDPVQALEKLWPRLQLVHLKDVERAGDDKNVVLGTGIAKSKAVIALLEKRGFAGLVAIEYEGQEQNPQPDVTRCVEFARQLM
ncbi:MAG TPA: sugar phosphate isomerase/epimerase family protein [Terriglobia bacterium]|nr:sugar phosphate isomerase/epimerase family protein [Terriglobia bacterium]